MRNPDRIPVVLEEIRKIWETKPDLRLGQLLWAMGSDFDIEDYDFLQSYANRTDKYEVDSSKFPIYWIGSNEMKNFIKNLSSSSKVKEDKS